MTYDPSFRKYFQFALFALVLPVTGAFAGPPADPPGQIVELAYLTIKDGLKVDDTAQAAVTKACGELGTAANEPKTSTAKNAKIIAGWGGDKYSGQEDPNSNPKVKYGSHVTVEVFDPSKPGDNKLSGRWHVYQSGAAWVDRAGTGSSAVYVCNG